MTRTPPTDADLEQALALGGTRIATAAHPLCICGESVPCPPEPDWNSAAYSHSLSDLTTAQERREFIARDRAQMRAAWSDWRAVVADALLCPMHPDGPGGRRA